MKAYIDKSALVAELNRLIAELVEEGEDIMFEQGRISAFEDVKVFINHTLEVKEVGVDFGDPQGDIGVKWVQEEPVSNDLEEAVKKYLTSLRKSHFEGYDIERAFKKGAQWQKEQMLKGVDLEKELIIWHRLHFKKGGTFEKYGGFYLANSSQLDLAKHFFELGLKAQQKGG